MSNSKTGVKFGAGWLALNKTTTAIDVPGVGAGTQKFAAFEAAYPNSIIPNFGFSYDYLGTTIKFYEGVPQECPPGLKALLLASGGSAKAAGLITVGGTGTAGGTLTATIGGTAVTGAADTASETPTAMAASLITAINANTTVNKLVVASAGTAGQIILTAVNYGASANSITLAVSKTDATATIAVTTAMNGGLNGFARS